MVDIQSVSVVIAGTSVVLYLINLYLLGQRDQINRKINLTNTYIEKLQSPEGLNTVIELIYLEWKDFEDFQLKYDTSVNPEHASRRLSMWLIMDNLGYLMKSGLIDSEMVYKIGAWTTVWIWMKYKPIIEVYRKTELGRDFAEDFEWLAHEMYKMKTKRDPNWITENPLFTEKQYEETFSTKLNR